MDTRELAGLTGAFDGAMAAEAVPDAVRRRVVNRLVWGHPDGVQDWIPADQAEDFLRAVDRDPDQRLPSSVIRLARPLAALHEAGEHVFPLPYGDLRTTSLTDDGTTAVRIDQADPLILVTDQLVALWRDGHLAPYVRFDGAVFEIAGVNRTVSYRLGRHLPGRYCYQAELVT